jgi:hypothetical protein
MAEHEPKLVRPDGSIGKEPGMGVVLIGAGSVACEALRKSGLGACMTIERNGVRALLPAKEALHA